MPIEKGTHLKKYNGYVDKLKENAEAIRDCVAKGMGIEAILLQLKIPLATYYNIIKENPDIDKPRREGQSELVFELKNELLNRCFKHTLTTTKTYKKKDVETGNETIYVEETKKEVDGEISAIHLLLKNNDKEWTDNPAEYKLKCKEFEWKRKKESEESGIDYD